MPAVALWIALFAGLSPTLVDLARHWLAEPWALPFAAFFPLWLLAAWSDAPARAALARPPRPAARWLGLAAVVAGLLVASFATASGSTRIGRLAVPVAVLGLAAWLGRPAPERALLAAWWIPLPHSLAQRVFPAVSAAAETAAEALAGVLGGAPLYAAGKLLPGADPVRIGAPDLGFALCWLLAGWGWYAAVQRGAGLAAAGGNALRLAALGLPLQILALGIAAALAGLGRAAAARTWLDLVPLAALAGACVWLLASRRAAAALLAPSRRLRSAR